MKKGKVLNKPLARSYSWKGLAKWRTQMSWKTLFLIVVFLTLAFTTVMLDEVFQAARSHSVELVKGMPMAAIYNFPKIVMEDKPNMVSHSSGLLSVRDIVAFPKEVMLLVEAVGNSNSLKPPSKDDLVCLFGKHYRTGIFSSEWHDDQRSVVAVRCDHPPQGRVLESTEATLLFKDSNFSLPSAVEYTTNSSWTPLVYESVTDADSVLLFVKGLVDTNGKPDNFSRSLNELYCSFSSNVRSRVKVVAQEVVRCELPPQNTMEHLKGARVSLFVPRMGLLQSVAYFAPPATPRLSDRPGGKQFHICSCTMVWNQGQFLREWIMYHGFLGIERWYLYDNNSDDDIEEVLAGLQPRYNVTRHAWPWIKTQEAGFSHCALRATPDCDWMLFADVDEFVFPLKDLHQLVYGKASSLSLIKGKKASKFWSFDSVANASYYQLYETALSSKRTSVLRSLINRTLQRGESLGKNVGEVRLVCHNFGPSGQSLAPKDGVMVGYTCRMEWPQRHKSFVLLDAIDESLMNVVHHFELRDGYKEIGVHSRIAVINHYKYQAWEVFKAKFVRRVATYVVDWQEQTALSNDRAPGLGLEAVKPSDWTTRYCEELDWGLRNFTENTFRQPRTNLMLWQSQ